MRLGSTNQLQRPLWGRKADARAYVRSGPARLSWPPRRDGQRTACLYAFDLLHLRATNLPPGITSGLTRSAEQSANVALCLEFANRGH